jgi:signal transduction histidine kinase
VKASPPAQTASGPGPVEGQELELLRPPADAPPPTEETVTALLSMIAHELRSPLQTLTMNVHLTAERLAGTEEVSRDWLLARLETQRRTTARLSRLVETFLGLAHIEEGRSAPMPPAPIDLRGVAADVIEGADADLAWAGCACELRAPAPVPGRWDRGRLEIVVSNLLTNAMKYGAGRPVVVEVAAAGPCALLHVRDQGDGIAPEDQARIFEKFARLPSSVVIPGVGLGLWIARHFVAELGGAIQVTSALGQGSTFSVTLPLEPA